MTDLRCPSGITMMARRATKAAHHHIYRIYSYRCKEYPEQGQHESTAVSGPLQPVPHAASWRWHALRPAQLARCWQACLLGLRFPGGLADSQVANLSDQMLPDCRCQRKTDRDVETETAPTTCWLLRSAKPFSTGRRPASILPPSPTSLPSSWRNSLLFEILFPFPTLANLDVGMATPAWLQMVFCF